MKKIVALFLILCMAAGMAGAMAAPGNYDLLVVGTTTAFSGNFFSGAMGNNVSDQDVRKLIHAYSLVSWDNDGGVYRPSTSVVTNLTVIGDRDYTFALSRNLRYSDGTPITAKDYAFSFILQTSRALAEAAGLRRDGSPIQGWAAYDEGIAGAISGFRIIGDYQLKITVSEAYIPNFFEMQIMDIVPYPISVLAPGLEVRDDGNGICLSGELTPDTLRTTLLDPDRGYASHPSVTSGPYVLTAYDGASASLQLNPEYIGDAEGRKPVIPEIIFLYEDSDALIGDLAAEKIDLAVRCARQDQSQSGMILANSDDFAMRMYTRNGLGFISFCTEKGPTADPQVRKALSMCIDRTALKDQYLGNFGIVIDGFYGIGQWMFQIANQTVNPEADKEKQEHDWKQITLANLPKIEFDPEQAAQILDAAGWNRNEQGDAFDPAADSVRYKNLEGRLTGLKIRLIYADNNRAGALLRDLFGQNLAEIGAELELQAVPMQRLLEKYYHQEDRDCDMIMLGTNFTNVYDPSTDFLGDTNRMNGITDPEFARQSRELTKTEPGNVYEYCEKWVKLLEYRASIVSEIPLYSDTYMDFFTAALQDYEPANYASWAEAVQYAYLGDYEREEPEEEEFGDEFVDEFE